MNRLITDFVTLCGIFRQVTYAVNFVIYNIIDHMFYLLAAKCNFIKVG